MSEIQQPPAVAVVRSRRGQSEPLEESSGPRPQEDVDRDEREATELTNYQSQQVDDNDGFRFRGSRGKASNQGPNRQAQKQPGWLGPLTRIWNRSVNIAVPHNESRDHLANERTFLAYLRTSLALATLGVTITQLLRLEHSVDPSGSYGYFTLGKPLGVLFQVAAMSMAVIGAHRFCRQQMSMARGKVWASGWELYFIVALFFFLILGIFVLLVAADIIKNASEEPI